MVDRKSLSDWARVDALTEEELLQSVRNDPDWKNVPADWLKNATPVYATKKEGKDNVEILD